MTLTLTPHRVAPVELLKLFESIRTAVPSVVADLPVRRGGCGPSTRAAIREQLPLSHDQGRVPLRAGRHRAGKWLDT